MFRNAAFALAIGVLAGTAARGDDAVVQAVEKAIKALNDAFENGNARAVKSLVTDGHIAVTPYYGRAEFAEQISTLPELKFTEYEAGKMQIKLLTPDTALVSYPLTQKGTFKGKPIPAKCLTAAVWVRKDGKWLEAHYQETAVEGK